MQIRVGIEAAATGALHGIVTTPDMLLEMALLVQLMHYQKIAGLYHSIFGLVGLAMVALAMVALAMVALAVNEGERC
jgi:hypothetical protein